MYTKSFLSLIFNNRKPLLIKLCKPKAYWQLNKQAVRMAVKLFVVFLVFAAVFTFSGRCRGQGYGCMYHPCKRQVRVQKPLWLEWAWSPDFSNFKRFKIEARFTIKSKSGSFTRSFWPSDVRANLYSHRGSRGWGLGVVATPPLDFCSVTIFVKYITSNRYDGLLWDLQDKISCKIYKIWVIMAAILDFT